MPSHQTPGVGSNGSLHAIFSAVLLRPALASSFSLVCACHNGIYRQFFLFASLSPIHGFSGRKEESSHGSYFLKPIAQAILLAASPASRFVLNTPGCWQTA